MQIANSFNEFIDKVSDAERQVSITAVEDGIEYTYKPL